MLVADGTLDPEGPAAESIADLWWLLLGLGTVVFVAVAVLLVGGLFRRRHAAGPDGSDGPDAGGETPARFHRWVIGGGVVMPVVVLMVVLGATVWTMRDVSGSAPRGALEVEIVGHQWWWEVRYPEDGVTTANELHIPVGSPVAIELTSADVIHSFWVPELAGKLDALPDGTNTLVIEADQPGEYRTECAEFCGLQHAQMGLIVVAEPAERFSSWVAGQQEPARDPADETARRGEEIFADAGCGSCHTVEGTEADGTDGPDLTHVASRPTIGAGAAPNAPQDLAAWVADPHTVKEGVAMPASDLSGDELEAVVAYLETLE
jgi:cytochrome c oxidase subunit II